MKRILAFALAFVAAFAVTLYLRFPYAEVAHRLLARAPLPGGVAVDFASLHPSGLGLAGRDLVVRQGEAVLFRSRHFRIDGLVATALHRAPHLATTVDLFGGRLRLAAAQAGDRYALALEAKGVAAGPLLAPLGHGLGEVAGSLDARLEYEGDPAQWWQGKGGGELHGGPGALRGITLLGQALPEIPYDRFEGRLAM
ncbi:MAG: type II secretion system protein GspN, partial [Nitrospirae bacterium]